LHHIALRHERDYIEQALSPGWRPFGRDIGKLMSTELKTRNSSIWAPRHVYFGAVLCLVLGVALGYLFRGSDASHASCATSTGRQSAQSQAQHRPTLEQMKQMADTKAKPLLAKLQSDPNNPDLLAQAGRVYESTHQFKEAAGYYEKSLALNPKDIATRNELASCLYYSGDTEGAMQQLDQSLQYDPKNPNSLFNLGMIRWQGKQDAQGAVTIWKKLLRTNPNLEPDKKSQVEKLIADATQHATNPHLAKDKPSKE
jgi:cytochrome c-type biogenesis protein CcmH/NrfG